MQRAGARGQPAGEVLPDLPSAATSGAVSVRIWAVKATVASFPWRGQEETP